MGSNPRTSKRSDHIVMVPFLAQGHLTLFLTLATRIQKRTNFTITIATTPLNLHNLRTSLSLAQSTSITLAPLPFSPSDHGLPPNAENTNSLTLPQIMLLVLASSALKSPFHDLIKKITLEQGSPPLCIISDVFLGWASEIARSCNTVNITFNTGGAYGTTAYNTVWQTLPHRNLPPGEEEFTLPGFPNNVKVHVYRLIPYIRNTANGSDKMSEFFRLQTGLSARSDGWICNTAEEVEEFGLKVMRNVLNLPVWAVGPLLPDESKAKPGHFATGSGLAEDCIKWLDSKPERSVLYLSFGSQNSLNLAQMTALAEGVELSRVSFIWAIRPPNEFERNAAFQPEWLPPGFETRVGVQGTGLLVKEWAPQAEILAHNSTGAFLSHCGWNSVMEGISKGVPIIGWPLAAEQGYNSMILVEELRVAVEICCGVDGVVEKEAVRDVVVEVMGGGGEALRRNAAEIGARIEAATKDEKGFEGSSVRALDEFVAYVTSKTYP